MVKLLALIGLTMIVSAIFAAIFLNGSGARCLPPSALGVSVTPGEKALNFGRFRGSASELKVLDALLAAAATASPAPTHIPRIAANDPGQYCRDKETALLVEIVGALLIALAVGVWTTRRG